MNSTKVRIDISISLPDKDEQLSLVGQEFVFGRSPNSKVHINDPWFSRSHFKIFLQDDAAWVCDLGSSNGTLLNNEKIESGLGSPLRSGDLLSVPNSAAIIKILKIASTNSMSTRTDSDTTVIDRTFINININDSDETAVQDLESEAGIDLSSLSQQIIEVAHQQVDQIIIDANEKANAIEEAANQEAQSKRLEALKASEKEVLEKHKKVDAQIDLFKKESLDKIQRDIELEKQKKTDDLHKMYNNDKVRVLKKIEEESKVLAIEHERKKESLLAELKQFEDQIAAKKVEYENIDTLFEQRLKKANDEMDLRLLSKKEEIEHLEETFSEEKKKHREIIEKEAEERQTELKGIIDALEQESQKNKEEIEKLTVSYQQEKIRLEELVERDVEAHRIDLQFTLKEIENTIAAKKNDLTKLELAHENQKNKQFQLLEAQVENKRFELEEQLSESEAKVAAAQKEFSNLFDHYDAKKNDQIAILEDLSKLKDDTQNEIKRLSAELIHHKQINEEQIASDKAFIETLHVDIEKFKKTKHELEILSNRMSQEYAERQARLEEVKNQGAAEESLVKQKKIMLQNIESEVSKLNTQKDAIIPKIAELNNELATLTKKMEAATQSTASIQHQHAKEVEALKTTFLQNKANLEEEMRKLRDAEEKRLQNLTRQELNQINKLKEESLKLVLDLEDSITKEISNATSKVFANTIGVEKFREIAPDYDKSIRTSLQSGVLKLLQNELSISDDKKAKNLSSKQKNWKPITISVAVSAVIFGVLPQIYRQVQDQNDPIRKQMEAQAREAAKAPIKKFTPTKVATLGTSFVNSVIYTEEFCEIYAQESFRSELMKKGSAYLYKQWQIDEEKSIQSYAMIFSMIDVLKSKTEKIDPDYEKRDIAKMEIIEKETMKKLEKILGNEVRLEAALKFQTRFYHEFLAQRGLASGVKETN